MPFFSSYVDKIFIELIKALEIEKKKIDKKKMK